MKSRLVFSLAVLILVLTACPVTPPSFTPGNHTLTLGTYSHTLTIQEGNAQLKLGSPITAGADYLVGLEKNNWQPVAKKTLEFIARSWLESDASLDLAASGEASFQEWLGKVACTDEEILAGLGWPRASGSCSFDIPDFRRRFRVTQACQDPVNFLDAGLEKAVKAALKGQNLTCGSLSNIKELKAFNHKITYLDGIAWLENLEKLHLGNNKIQDIGALAGLAKLKSVDLGYNEIIDIRALASLKLEYLRLYRNKVTSIKPLAKMQSLTYLSVSYNSIKDISPVLGLSELVTLGISGNTQISDLSIFRVLPKLERLAVGSSRVTDLRPLTQLPLLQAFYAQDNSITSIAPLLQLPNLKALNLTRNNNIIDIASIQNLNKLEALYLSETELTDISFLQGLQNLKTLNITNNNVQDISVMANLKKMTYLHIGNNPIQDISALTGLTELQTLQAQYTEIKDINALRNLTKLSFLYLYNNRITNVHALTNLPELKTISLSNNYILDISPLVNNSGIGKGDELYIHNNCLEGLAQIQALKNRDVSINSTKQKDTCFLLTLNSLTPAANTSLQAGPINFCAEFSFLFPIPTMTLELQVKGQSNLGTSILASEKVSVSDNDKKRQLCAKATINNTYPSIEVQGRLLLNQLVRGQSSTVRFSALPQVDIAAVGLYITQSVQNLDNNVPLIKDRPAVARAFAISSETQEVKAKLYAEHNGKVLGSLEATARLNKTLDQGNTRASFQWKIPDDWLKTGIEFYLQVDPDNLVRESNENNNRYPAEGALVLTMRSQQPLEVMLIPVRYKGQTATINDTTAQELLGYTSRIYPLPGIKITRNHTVGTGIRYQIRQPYTFDTTKDFLDTLDVLNDIAILEQTEGKGQYYHAIIPTVTTENGGNIAGRARLDSKIAVSKPYPSTIAHEFGHNFNRRHVDCGGPKGIDPNYPYAGGHLGAAWGYDIIENRALSAERYVDLMSYCGPEWISDYTYKAVLTYRSEKAGDSMQVQSSDIQQIQDVMMVSGQVVDGELTLAPLTLWQGHSRIPQEQQRMYTLEAFDNNGSVIIQQSFNTYTVADTNEDIQQFNFSIPISKEDYERIAVVKVKDKHHTVVAQITPSLDTQAIDNNISVIRQDDGQVQINWDATVYPQVIIIDGDTGVILTIGRSGNIVVETGAKQLEFVLSDGLNTQRRIITIK